MEQRIAYCSACDRPVRVLVKDDAPAWPEPEAADPTDIVCLEYGENCTGSMCPIFDVATEQMKRSFDAHQPGPDEGGVIA